MNIEIGDNLLAALPQLRTVLMALSLVVPGAALLTCACLVSYASDILDSLARVIHAWRGK